MFGFYGSGLYFCGVNLFIRYLSFADSTANKPAEKTKKTK